MEKDQSLDGSHWIAFEPSQDMLSRHSQEEINYHIRLLIEAGMVKGNLGPVFPTVSKLTWDGHEFLDNIKDSDVWSKTKERLKGLPGVALSVVGELAKAEIKKKLGLA